LAMCVNGDCVGGFSFFEEHRVEMARNRREYTQNIQEITKQYVER
jgi:hypothetical protein